MILAIETSCDETAVALFDPDVGIVGEWIHSQVVMHAMYGGVVPDLASREHLANLPQLMGLAREHAAWARISKVVVTSGPGLAACLALGLSAAKAVSLQLRVPLAGINHLRGHAWSPFIETHRTSPSDFQSNLDSLLPHLGLIASGGNTLLFSISKERTVHVIASTRDDAAGEALDKAAKLMGLGYPGGPLVEKKAIAGRADAFDFPRALNSQADAFSFSGLKTSLRYLVEKLGQDETAKRINDLCASYQEAVVDSLVRKVRIALKETPYASAGVSGGVANNLRLRHALGRLCAQERVPFLVTLPKHTGDNAGMIAFAGWMEPEGVAANGFDLEINPGAELTVRGE